MARGRLITIEGLGGAGKTTLAAALERALAARVGAGRGPREPGGGELAARGRAPGKDPERRGGARAAALPYGLELEDEIFFRAVASAYDRLAEAEPERIRVLDAGADPDTVLAAGLAALADLLPDQAA